MSHRENDRETSEIEKRKHIIEPIIVEARSHVAGIQTDTTGALKAYDMFLNGRSFLKYNDIPEKLIADAIHGIELFVEVAQIGDTIVDMRKKYVSTGQETGIIPVEGRSLILSPEFMQGFRIGFYGHEDLRAEALQTGKNNGSSFLWNLLKDPESSLPLHPSQEHVMNGLVHLQSGDAYTRIPTRIPNLYFRYDYYKKNKQPLLALQVLSENPTR